VAGRKSRDVAVILAALVLVADEQRDRLPVVLPSYRPERISTVSDSRRWVTWRECWLAAVKVMLDVGLGERIPGGQPSTTQPMRGRAIRRTR